MMKLLFAAATAVAMAAGAEAATVNLSFASAANSGYSVTGSGAFTTAASGTIGLADLSSFSFDDLYADYGLSFHYELADLTSFSAFLDGDAITQLSFTTTQGNPTPGDQNFYTQSVSVEDLSTNGTSLFTPYGAVAFGQTTASVDASESAVPEPASWAMMVGGFGLIGGAMRRKKVAVSFA